MDSKSAHLHFFTWLLIMFEYGPNNQDLFQKFESDNTTNYLFQVNFGDVLSNFILCQSLSLEAQSQSLDSDQSTVTQFDTQ